MLPFHVQKVWSVGSLRGNSVEVFGQLSTGLAVFVGKMFFMPLQVLLEPVLRVLALLAWIR